VSNKRIAIIAVAILAVACICVVLALPEGTEREDQPTQEAARQSYDDCVRRCVQNARDANIERTDITDDDYQIIIAEHKNYICPGRCEEYK